MPPRILAHEERKVTIEIEESEALIEVFSNANNSKGFKDENYRNGVMLYFYNQHVIRLVKYLIGKDIKPVISYAHMHTLQPQEETRKTDGGVLLKEVFNNHSSLNFEYDSLGGRLFRVRIAGGMPYLIFDSVKNHDGYTCNMQLYSNRVFKMRRATIESLMADIRSYMGEE